MSIITGWINPFANKMDDVVQNELDRRRQYLSAVSRNEISDSSLLLSTRIATDQIFTPQVGTNNSKPKTQEALEWVYQKVAYARVQPISLKKVCTGENDTTSTKSSTPPPEPDLPAPSPGARRIEASIPAPDASFWSKTSEDKVDTAIKSLPSSFQVLNEKAKADELKKIPTFVALSEQEQELFYKKYFNLPGNSYADKRINDIINYARGNAALLPPTINMNISLIRKTPPPLKIEKERAPFFISTAQFKDKNGNEDGVIESYGEKLYSVPQVQIGEDGKALRDDKNNLIYTVRDSPYRPTVRNGDPSAVLTSVSIVNEGVVGSVLRAKLTFKVFTKEALNVIDKWLLRPGNEVDIQWGWSVNTSASNSQRCNNEYLNAVIFNFSCDYAQDNTWDITVDAIAKGSLVSGVSFEVQDVNFDTSDNSSGYDPSSLAAIVPNLQGVIEIELKTLNISGSGPGPVLESKELLTQIYGSVRQSKAFPHGIAQFIHPLAEQDDSAVTSAGYIGLTAGGLTGVGVGLYAGSLQGAVVLGGIGAYGGKTLFEAVTRLFVESDYATRAVSYICLADLVHFYNKTLTQYFPRELQTFEIQVENSPTSYDPNIVSSDPTNIMFSDALGLAFNYGMSTYGESNRAIKTDDASVFPHIYSFYDSKEIKSWQDCVSNHTVGHPQLNIPAGNLGHIWISTDAIKSIFLQHKLNTAVDPRFRNVFAFFEEIFKLINNATGGAIKPTFVQYNTFESEKRNKLPSNMKSVIWIVDTNFMTQGMGVEESRQVNKEYTFEVNNVHSTLVRNVNARLKLPSSMQATAYTYGRAGMNDSVQSIDDIAAECTSSVNGVKSVKDNKATAYNALQRLSIAKELSQYSAYDTAVQETLQAALYGYVGCPVKYTNADAKGVTQGWLFSRLYPAELSFELDGIAGIKYGNMIRIKDALPDRYFNKIYFTVTKLEHTIVNHDWKLNVTAIARVKNSEINIGHTLSEKELQAALQPRQNIQEVAPAGPMTDQEVMVRGLSAGMGL